MARKAKATVLDSWAVMAYLEDETAGKEVADLIVDAHQNDKPLFMSVVNAGEVWYILARELSVVDADNAITDLRQLGIEFVDADWPLAKLAGSFKAQHKMSLADCYAAALAKLKKAELVTGDKEFRQVDNEINIHWL